jgi:serine O-acetyltransferase
VLVLDLNKLLNGCVIGRGAEFAPGFVLVHTVGVVIHGSVRGGRNVIIESGVVVGAARNGFPIEVPVIGDDVYIGAGAKLLGGIRIGSRVTIGANAVVVKDVPDDATAVGVPAKVIGRAGPA